MLANDNANEVRSSPWFLPRIDAFSLSDQLFVKNFRLSKELVRQLVMEINPYINHTSRSSSIDVTTKMDLRSQNEKILQWLEESDTESIPDNQSQSDSEEDNNNLETEIHFETDESDVDVAVSSEDDVFLPRTGRSRRLVIDSDSDDVIQPRQNILYGKNQHKWSTIPRDPRTRTGARNVLHIVPGPVDVLDLMTKILDERRESDRLAPIRDVWEKFIENCKKWYKPGSYITVDEQLVGFRGRCPFRMYIPNKPNKYGLKLVMVADSSTKYMCNAIPCMGKNTNTGNEPLANYFVKELCKPYQGSNRNITMDNWFTLVPLAAELLKPPYKFTVVGTLRSNKREIPKEMVNTRNKPVGTSIFGFDKEMTLVSYKPKTNKIVYLLSTRHDQPSINANSKKPEIIEFYNSTKGAVDTVDQMCSIMSTSRKTNRWPLCLFFNILNLTIVNAYVIHVSNAIRNGTKPMKRRPFALKWQMIS
ncbi:PiggyBac transposable element-derived protein 4 [Eumeta japonica]|uniref:PiggyBac transposable element-derived protein 4 n=1 Tax=Eumeta variegata TaxID=151549 RepID=A0A4C1SR11_EUMVA|nr:PiggyBac transposable element-derived protein 4 [Eumeta japonica]